MFFSRRVTFMVTVLVVLLIQTNHAIAESNESATTWYMQLTPEQRLQVEQILREERPLIQDLRQKMGDKVAELKAFAYAQDTDPDVFPRLGRELQSLRDQLYTALLALEDRLTKEVGVNLGDRRSRGCADLSQSRY